jgi:hypothetical protein
MTRLKLMSCSHSAEQHYAFHGKPVYDYWWHEGFDTDTREMYLKSVGLLLLEHYRVFHLLSYLRKLSGQYPGVINSMVFSAIEELRSNIVGPSVDINNLTSLVLKITGLVKLCERAIREKVANYVMKLKDLDKKIFDSIIN